MSQETSEPSEGWSTERLEFEYYRAQALIQSYLDSLSDEHLRNIFDHHSQTLAEASLEDGPTSLAVFAIGALQKQIVGEINKRELGISF